MSPHRELRTAHIAAAPDVVFAALTDYEELPSWQRALKDCVVLSRRPDGLGDEVEYVIDAKLREVRYVLAHDYDPPERIGSAYLRGDLAGMEGEWRLAPTGGGTSVSLKLAIDPGLPVPGPLKRQIRRRVLDRSLEDLGRRFGHG